jgi:hypothetical protein
MIKTINHQHQSASHRGESRMGVEKIHNFIPKNSLLSTAAPPTEEQLRNIAAAGADSAAGVRAESDLEHDEE